jgi:hypothetical protein
MTSRPATFALGLKCQGREDNQLSPSRAGWRIRGATPSFCDAEVIIGEVHFCLHMQRALGSGSAAMGRLHVLNLTMGDGREGQARHLVACVHNPHSLRLFVLQAHCMWQTDCDAKILCSFVSCLHTAHSWSIIILLVHVMVSVVTSYMPETPPTVSFARRPVAGCHRSAVSGHWVITSWRKSSFPWSCCCLKNKSIYRV